MDFKTLRAFISQACTIFTAIILIICLFIGISGKQNTLAIWSAEAFGIFGFCLAVSAANLIYKTKRFSFFIRYLIHLIITIGASAVLLYKINELAGQTVLVAEIVIFVIHAALFITLFCREKKQSRENTDYVNMYEKLKKH